MTLQANLFSDSSLTEYNGQAFGYIDQPNIKQTIQDAANFLGISKAAIAGAMVEEAHDYWENQQTNDWSDNYARSDVDPVAVWIDVTTFGEAILGTLQGPESVGERTHQQWLDEYAKVATTADDYHDKLDKILHPAG
jgi:hypothetical protein